MENFIAALIAYVIWGIIDNFIVKHQIKSNIDLFYDLHRKEVDRQLRSRYPISDALGVFDSEEQKKED